MHQPKSETLLTVLCLYKLELPGRIALHWTVTI